MTCIFYYTNYNRPNIQIMGGFLNTAIKLFDPSYVYWVIEETNRREIKVDSKLVLLLEEFKGIVKKGIISKVCINSFYFLLLSPNYLSTL